MATRPRKHGGPHDPENRHGGSPRTRIRGGVRAHARRIPGWYAESSAFASEADRRAAYEAHRDRLGGWLGGWAGNRSWAFWNLDTDLPERPEGDELLLWLAEHGHLESAELAKIAQISADAKARIGTTAEVSADVKTAALDERVTKALP